jgi:hypothetical protein
MDIEKIFRREPGVQAADGARARREARLRNDPLAAAREGRTRRPPVRGMDIEKIFGENTFGLEMKSRLPKRTARCCGPDSGERSWTRRWRTRWRWR